MPDRFQEWAALRKRLHAQERALAQARAAYLRGEKTDLTAVAIQQSEVRALRALSRSLLKESLKSVRKDADSPGRAR